MTPKLSVIMSAYNSSKTIDRAITSVLKQSFTNFEMIILNDGSTDDTESLILSSDDSRIQYHSLEHGGLTKALNIGISNARSEIIVRHDSDDWSEPDRFAVQAQRFEEDEKLALVASWHNVVGADGTYFGHKESPTDDESLKKMLRWRNPFCHGSVAVRKSALQFVGGYDDNLLYSQDYDLWLRMAAVGLKFSSVPQSLYNYSITPDSIAKGWHKLGYAENIRQNIDDQGKSSRYSVTSIPAMGKRRTSSLWNYALGSLALEEGHRGRAFIYFTNSLASDPRQWRALLRLGATLLPRFATNQIFGRIKRQLESSENR